MAVRKPSIHFSPAFAAPNNRSFNWFVIGEKENRERSTAENRLCRMPLYEIKSRL